MLSNKLSVAALLLLSLAACSRKGELDPSGGIRVVRSACPAVGVPANTGDVTLFDPPTSRDARAIDVVATITNVRTTCDESGAQVVATATFDVLARRANPRGARDVVLPYFSTVVRGGNVVVAKRISQVGIHFADGQLRASASGQGGANIAKSAATLPETVRDQITKKRKAGEEDAAIDPLSEPTVRQAVARASFELLVGFQLTPEQLQYNATR